MSIGYKIIVPLLLLFAILAGCAPRDAEEVARGERTDGTIRFEEIERPQGDPGLSAIGSSDAAIRQRWVKHDLALFADIPKEGEPIAVEVFEDVAVVAEVAEVETGDGGELQITARFPDEPFGVFWLSISESGIIGTIQTEGRFFDLFTVEPGVVRITEFDQGRFPPDRDMGDGSGFNRERAALPSVRAVVAAGLRQKVIRILLLFPMPTFQPLCSPPILSSIGFAVRSEINKVWRSAAQSEVVAQCIRYQPRGQDLIDFVDNGGRWQDYTAASGRSVDVDFEWLESDLEPAALRDRHSADLVAMVLPVYLWCGAARTNNPPVTAADARDAYAVVRFDCARGSFSIQHEVGHVMGMRHDRQAETTDTASNCNYGYICRQGTNVVGRTVMAYRKSCKDLGGTDLECKTRFPTYSVARPSADPFAQSVNRCGIPCGSTTTRPTTGSANNFDQLRTAAPVVSQFR